MKVNKSETITNVITTNTYNTKYKDISIVETIINDKQTNIRIDTPKENNEKYGVISLVKNSFFDYIKTNNPFDNNYKDLIKHLKNYNYLSLEEIYNAIQKDEFVFFYNNGHQIFNSNKQILSYAKEFNYVNSIFENENMDLDSLLEYLKESDFVLNKKELKISDIHYYNCSEVLNSHIEASIYIGDDLYRKIYDLYKDKDNWSTYMNSFVNYRLNENTDILGVLKFKK